MLRLPLELISSLWCRFSPRFRVRLLWRQPSGRVQFRMQSSIRSRQRGSAPQAFDSLLTGSRGQGPANPCISKKMTVDNSITQSPTAWAQQVLVSLQPASARLAKLKALLPQRRLRETSTSSNPSLEQTKGSVLKLLSAYVSLFKKKGGKGRYNRTH